MRYIWLIPLLPGIGAAINGLVGIRSFSRRTSGAVAVTMMTAALAVSLVAFWQLLGLDAEARAYDMNVADWIPQIPLATHDGIGLFHVTWGFRLDPLAGMMLLVVTGIGTLIHVYSTAYMADEPRGGVSRFFCYLNLFCFFMLMLVLGDNFLLMFVGWEGVGLCSYLLIGYYLDKHEAAPAAKKAFVANRVGDWGFVMGILLLFWMTSGAGAPSISFFNKPGLTSALATVASMPVDGFGWHAIFAGGIPSIAVLLFIGATGKSAQIPLFVWLPDAMAGPTPVSALIHAATMVTAGVYMVVRSHVLFEISGVALTVVLVVGLLTALFGATCAIAQFDIKRVLAYSTISQLGYMFIAVGMRAYGVAMFFLAAHACYKAVMFLGAGSVIHGMHDEQDMRAMGGLRRPLPWTFATFAIGGLAQAGVPPLAGFFAKDALLEVANHTSREVVYVLGTIAAFATAFYIGRMICMTFLGRAGSDRAEHAHESPWVMVAPLVLLAIGVVGVGVLQLNPEGAISRALEPVVGATALGAGLSVVALVGIAVAVAVISLSIAWLIYGSGRVDPVAFRARMEPMATAAQRGWYVDRAYDVAIVQPSKALARLTSDVVDALVIDGAVNGIAGLVKRSASGGKLVQTGFVRTYALVLFLGAVLLLGFIGVRG